MTPNITSSVERSERTFSIASSPLPIRQTSTDLSKTIPPEGLIASYGAFLLNLNTTSFLGKSFEKTRISKIA